MSKLYKNLDKKVIVLLLACLVMAVLKVTDMANISWQVVAAPIWVPVGAFIMIFIVSYIVSLIENLFK